MEDKPLSEEEKGAKEDKSGRQIKKNGDFSSVNFNQTYAKIPVVCEAHNRIYLMAVISEPLISILSEPPELV